VKNKLENLTALTRNELDNLSKDEVIEIALRENKSRIDLWYKVHQNSTNSSRPPSTDSIAVKVEKSNTRQLKNGNKSKKKSGGQKGHIGKTLQKQEPTKVIKILKYDPFSKPGKLLKSCQIIDIITRKEIIEYQLITTKTKNAETINAVLPGNYVQYSNKIKALIPYFSTEHAVSEDRIIRLFWDIFNLKISKGTVSNCLVKASKLLEKINSKILKSIRNAPVIGSDETFMSCKGKLTYLWNWQTPNYSFFRASENRKFSNVQAVIPNFKGILVSDRYIAHLKLPCDHQVCTVHLQRNIQALDNLNFKKILLDIIGKAQKADISLQNHDYYKQRLKNALEKLPPDLSKKTISFAEYLLKSIDYIFVFLKNVNVPHHNNGSEIELRKSKVKLKVAGCFRTMGGFKVYAKILTFIQTCRKQSCNVYHQLQSLFAGKASELRYC
jgi:transposase